MCKVHQYILLFFHITFILISDPTNYKKFVVKSNNTLNKHTHLVLPYCIVTWRARCHLYIPQRSKTSEKNKWQKWREMYASQETSYSVSICPVCARKGKIRNFCWGANLSSFISSILRVSGLHRNRRLPWNWRGNRICEWIK